MRASTSIQHKMCTIDKNNKSRERFTCNTVIDAIDAQTHPAFFSFNIITNLKLHCTQSTLKYTICSARSCFQTQFLMDFFFLFKVFFFLFVWFESKIWIDFFSENVSGTWKFVINATHKNALYLNTRWRPFFIR